MADRSNIKFLSIFIILFVVLAFVLILPGALYAQATDQGVVPCGQDINHDGVVTGSEQCGFKDIIKLISNIINKLIMIVSFLAAVGFTYAGFLYITAAGQESRVDRAKEIIKKIMLGYVIMLVAWVFIHAIEQAFYSTDTKARPSSFLSK